MASLSIFPLEKFRHYFRLAVDDLKSIYNIRQDEYEDIYDWVVVEAMQKFLRNYYNATVRNHYPYDLGKCIYLHVGEFIENYIHDQLTLNRLYVVPGGVVKLLVQDNVLIMAVKQ